jgi:hypothetical protein
MRFASKRIGIAAFAAWIVAIVVGMAAVGRYEATPGVAAAAAPSDWPRQSAVQPAAGKFTLLLFMHPQCPCSTATLSDLDRLLTKYPDRVATTVVFVTPANAPKDWETTSLWNSARNTANVKTLCDRGGNEARLFDAATSGQTMLYSPAGKLLFRGGLTESRGHEGDNDGSDAIADLIEGRPAAATSTPVFGCPLQDAVTIPGVNSTCKK